MGPVLQSSFLPLFGSLRVPNLYATWITPQDNRLIRGHPPRGRGNWPFNTFTSLYFAHPESVAAQTSGTLFLK